MSPLRAFALIAAIPFLPVVAGAAEPGWYVGAAYALVSADINEVGDGMDAHTVDDGSGFKLIAGFQILDWLAIEANYADLGKGVGNAEVACIPEEPCGSEFDFETRAWSVAALASFAAGPVDFFARAGFSSWESDVRFAGTPSGMSAQIDGTDPVFGVGIRLNLRAVTLRFEVERQDLDANSMDVASLGATYTFGR